MIIETCPKCGADLMHEVICTYPPIPKVSCPKCGWYHEAKSEPIERIPWGAIEHNVSAQITAVNLNNHDTRYSSQPEITYTDRLDKHE